MMVCKECNKKDSSLAVLLFFIVCIFLSTACSSASAAVEAGDCTVGDLTKGTWVKIPNNIGLCPIPGPPAAESPWGWGADVNSSPYRIQGHYKVVGYMSADGWALEPPPSKPNCITGYAEEYAKYYCDNQWTNGVWTQTYTASSNLCTMSTTGPNNYYHAQYLRFYDWVVLYEWRCGTDPDPEPEKGAGPPCDSSTQCCKDNQA